MVHSFFIIKMLKFSPNITVLSPEDFFYKILVLTLVFRWESTTFLNHFHLTDWWVGSLWTGETVCWASSALCHWIPVWISWIVQNTGLDLRWNWSRKTLLKNKVKVKVGVNLKIRMTNMNITTSRYFLSRKWIELRLWQIILHFLLFLPP